MYYELCCITGNNWGKKRLNHCSNQNTIWKNRCRKDNAENIVGNMEVINEKPKQQRVWKQCLTSSNGFLFSLHMFYNVYPKFPLPRQAH